MACTRLRRHCQTLGTSETDHDLLEAIVLLRPSQKQRQSATHGERRPLQEDVLRLEPEGRTETLETKVVSLGVEGVYVDSNGGAELNGDAPQFREETVDEELLVPCKRVQQLTPEQFWDVPRDDVKYSAAAAGTTVTKSVSDGKARPPDIEKHSTTTESNVAASSGEARSSGPKAGTEPPLHQL